MERNSKLNLVLGDSHSGRYVRLTPYDHIVFSHQSKLKIQSSVHGSPHTLMHDSKSHVSSLQTLQDSQSLTTKPLAESIPLATGSA